MENLIVDHTIRAMGPWVSLQKRNPHEGFVPLRIRVFKEE
jgi:hypothetical protein